MQSYKYDAAGRLAEVSNTAGTHTNAYGASNQRLQVTEVGTYGNTTLYAWDGGSVIAEYNGVGSGMAWTKSYVYLGGRLLATESALTTSTTEIKYHHPDRLGTRLVTNSAGAVVSENISLPFGNTISGESNNLAGSATKKRFTSYDRSDTTKLDYAVNRHYSSAQGRFTQVDPIGMGAVYLSNPQYLNLYAYCLNDPINLIDPSGLFAMLALAPEASTTPVGAIIFWTAVAVIGVLRLIFGGRAKSQTRMVGQTSQRLAQIETGDGGAWIEPAILSGVGAVSAFVGPTQAQKKCGELIASIARKNIGDPSWRTDRKRTTKDGKITSPADRYKCNLFVYEVLKKAGVAGVSAPTSGGKGKWPAQAGDWANKKANIPGWEVVTDGTSLPGDVISQGHVGPGYTGHVSIGTGNEETTGTAGNGEITTTSWGFRGIITSAIWGGKKEDVTVRRNKCK